MKVGVWYNSIEETLQNLGLPPNRRDGEKGFLVYDTDGKKGIAKVGRRLASDGLLHGAAGGREARHGAGGCRKGRKPRVSGLGREGRRWAALLAASSKSRRVSRRGETLRPIRDKRTADIQAKRAHGA